MLIIKSGGTLTILATFGSPIPHAKEYINALRYLQKDVYSDFVT
ncbi:hypothetical protein CLV62_104149 [Dysgonomonas alginatilytica]|uniref:Uncharacterized protein n=1 Tax=Dysgonomonas alginatilytica TaxID=1605892 RepID=A0A2V3PTR3_9BACT|nr:hypothetical protein CLV62_104149 [Dysgonomonas alginatilytica]